VVILAAARSLAAGVYGAFDAFICCESGTARTIEGRCGVDISIEYCVM
jgi:hypothetical protein